MKEISRRASRTVASAIREILKVTEQPAIISLAGGLPNPALFPVEQIRFSLAQLMDTVPQACLQYGATEGLIELRDWIANRYSTPSQKLTAENVIITTGSQQALDLLGKAFINSGDRVLVENPSYLGAIQAMSLYQPQFVTLPERNNALDVAQLDSQHLSAKLVYLIPNFQNPTGRLMDLETRLALARLSRAHEQLLIEDDPYGEIQFTGDKLPTLRSLCPENTVYLGSFSKILAPGLRVGYVVADPAIIRTLTLLKQSADLHTPSLNQHLVLALLKAGLYSQQVEAVCRHYGRQCQHMIAAIRNHFPKEVHVMPPDGGMFVWCELPPAMNATKLLEEAIRHQIAFVPGEYFYVKNPKPNTLRLSFATTPTEKMDAAIKVLGELIAEQLAMDGASLQSVR